MLVEVTYERSPSSEVEKVTLIEKKLEGVRAILPERGIIGYISDLAPAGTADEEYFLTQYVLAPLVVADDVYHSFVLANMHKADSKLTVRDNLKLIKVFPSGVLLFKHNDDLW